MASLNSLSSLSKIYCILWHLSAIFGKIRKISHLNKTSVKFKKACHELWLVAALFWMTRTKVMPRAGQRRGMLPSKTSLKRMPPSPKRPPSSPRELERRRRKLRRLEAVGRSPASLPMRELAQMVAEVSLAPSTSVDKAGHMRSTTLRKAPWKEFIKSGLKKPQRYQSGDSCSLWDIQISKEHGVAHP